MVARNTLATLLLHGGHVINSKIDCLRDKARCPNGIYEMTSRAFRQVAVLLTLVLIATSAFASGQWASFGGPTGKFLAGHVPDALHDKPALLWKHSVKGKSYGPISADDGIVIIPDHGEGKDWFYALHPQTGKLLWEHVIENSKPMEFGASPRVAPLLHDGKVYLLNAYGNLHVLDREDGSVVWRRNLAEDFDADVPDWGYCSPMVILPEGLVTNPGGAAGGLVCLNPLNGEVVWTSPSGPANYAAPLHATFSGKRQFIYFDATSLRSVNPADGSLLWELPVEADSGYICPAPVKLDDTHVLLVDQDNGARVHVIGEQGISAEPLVESFDIYAEISTPVVLDGIALFFYYELLGADVSTLDIRWRNSEEDSFAATHFGYPIVDLDSKRVLFFTGTGMLHLIEVSSGEMRILQKNQLTGKTETCPALVDNILFVREDKGVAYAYRLWGNP